MRRITRWGFVFLAFLQAAFTSGIIFGWPALEKVFVIKGVYSDHCKQNNTEPPCEEQSDFYNLIYTVAVFVNNGAPLVTGLVLDRVGPKWTNIGSAILFFIGCALFALPNELVIIPAYALLGLAGPGIYCSIMHLCNLFPGHQGTVLSFFSGTFSLSSFIFRVFEILYRQDNQWRSLRALFLEYIVLIAPLFIVGAFAWPNRAFEAPGKVSLIDAEAEQTPLISPSEKNILLKKTSLYNVDYKKQFKSPLYWIPVFWLALSALNISCYLGTVGLRFSSGNYADVFNIIWSLGFVAIPFFGAVIDTMGNMFAMNVASVGLIIFNVLKLIGYNNIQYVSFVLVSTVNVGMWAIFYSYLSAKFGFDNYGKLLGVSSAFTASIGALQYGVDWITTNKFNKNYFYADVLFMALSVICLVMSIYMWYEDKMPAKKPKKVVEYYPAINSTADSGYSG